MPEPFAADSAAASGLLLDLTLALHRGDTEFEDRARAVDWEELAIRSWSPAARDHHTTSLPCTPLLDFISPYLWEWLLEDPARRVANPNDNTSIDSISALDLSARLAADQMVIRWRPAYGPLVAPRPADLSEYQQIVEELRRRACAPAGPYAEALAARQPGCMVDFAETVRWRDIEHALDGTEIPDSNITRHDMREVLRHVYAYDTMQALLAGVEVAAPPREPPPPGGLRIHRIGVVHGEAVVRWWQAPRIGLGDLLLAAARRESDAVCGCALCRYCRGEEEEEEDSWEHGPDAYAPGDVDDDLIDEAVAATAAKLRAEEEEAAEFEARLAAYDAEIAAWQEILKK